MNKTYYEMKDILRQLFDERIYNIKNLTPNQVKELIDLFDDLSKNRLRGSYRQKEIIINTRLKKAFHKFVRDGDKTFKPIIKAYNYNQLKPKLKKELEKATIEALSRVKTNDIAFLNKVKDNLLGYVSNAKVKRTKGAYYDAVLPRKYNQAWHDMVVRDQTHKLISNLTYITAIENSAIGFVWKHRHDIRVVGNPQGLYPKGNHMHNNHWERDGRLYLFRDSQAVKNGYINKNDSKVEWADEIEDGIAGQPINCRCTMRIIFRLYEIPKEYESIISKKGWETIKR